MSGLTFEERHAIQRVPTAGLAFAAVAMLVTAAAYVWERPLPESPPLPVSPIEPVPVGSAPAGGVPALNAASTASLDEGEALARELIGGLTGDRSAMRWLDEPHLLQRWVAATQLFFDGDSPTATLGFLRVTEPFEVDEQDGRLVPSAPTEHRYDAVVRALGKIAPEQAAQVYGQLRPFAQVAYAEIGPPGSSFDAVLRAALVRLDATGVPQQPLELRLQGALYEYADPQWEALSAAQKALLRLGPRNARALQEWTSRFLQALPPLPR